MNVNKPLLSLALAGVLAATSLSAMAVEPQAGASNTPEHNTGNPSTQANPSSTSTGGNGGASIPDPQRTPSGQSKATHDAHSTTGSGAVGGNSSSKGTEKQQ